MKRVAFLAGILCLLAPMAIGQFNASTAQGFADVTWGPFDVNQQTALGVPGGTGNLGSLGVVEVAGSYYVSARGSASPATGNWVTTPPHTVYEFDANGNLSNFFPADPLSSASAWGYRDGATDGQVLMFGCDAGLFLQNTDGTPATSYQAANGIQNPAILPITGAGIGAIGNYRAVAYDPFGDNGNGSWFSASFGTDIIEYDQAGNILGTYLFDGQWSIYGLALDPSTIGPGATNLSLWCNSRPNAGPIAELLIDRTAVTATWSGVNIQVSDPAGVQGGLSGVIGGAGNNGNDWDLVGLEQGSPDEITGYRVRLYSSLPWLTEPVFEGETTDICGNSTGFGKPQSTRNPSRPAGYPTVFEPIIQVQQGNGINWRTNELNAAGTASGKLGLPQATWMNIFLPAFPVIDGASFFVGTTQINSFAEFAVLWGGSLPTAAAGSSLVIFGGPPQINQAFANGFSGPALAAYPVGTVFRTQAFYIDLITSPQVPTFHPGPSGLPAPTLPLIATNQIDFELVAGSSTGGILFRAFGTNSFNANTTEGFFSISRDGQTYLDGIQSIVLTCATTMVYDYDQTGSADLFAGGNSAVVGCQGTYRNGSDVATGLVYGGTLVPPCDATALTGWVNATGSLLNGPDITFNFGGAFTCGVFEFDCDTDGGAGINGEAMAGMTITVNFTTLPSLTGTLVSSGAGTNESTVLL